MNSNDLNEMLEEYGGEKILGEDSYKTPVPSTPDTCITNTVSCPTPDERILFGDFVVEEWKGLPQLTLGLIKPDGMKFLKEIEKRINDAGFGIVQVSLAARSKTQKKSNEFFR